MENTAEILCQISSLKDMLDQVNEEIESYIQTTREIESEIVKCSEAESVLAVRESELTKTLYILQFEINGLVAVAGESRKSVELLETEVCFARGEREEVKKRIDDKRGSFCMSCLEFQRAINNGEKDDLRVMLSDKELLANEIHLLEKKNSTLKNSMLAFAEEILEDINFSNSALLVEIENGKQEYEKLFRDIESLRTTLHQLS